MNFGLRATRKMHALDEHFAVELILACITRGGEFRRSFKDGIGEPLKLTIAFYDSILNDSSAVLAR
jgi:hypothetical protein